MTMIIGRFREHLHYHLILYRVRKKKTGFYAKCKIVKDWKTMVFFIVIQSITKKRITESKIKNEKDY